MSEEHSPLSDPVDWALRRLDLALDTLHDKVIRPILLATRVLAFSFVLALLGLVVVVAGVIGTMRLLNVYVFDHRVWLTYLVTGGLCLLGGLLIWRRRRPIAARKK